MTLTFAPGTPGGAAPQDEGRPAAAPADASSEYVSPASQALLAAVTELSLRPLEPAPLAALAERLGEPRDRVFRALRNLEAAGWAEQVAGGWRLAPSITLISERWRLALADAHRRFMGPG